MTSTWLRVLFQSMSMNFLWRHHVFFWDRGDSQIDFLLFMMKLYITEGEFLAEDVLDLGDLVIALVKNRDDDYAIKHVIPTVHCLVILIILKLLQRNSELKPLQGENFSRVVKEIFKKMLITISIHRHQILSWILRNFENWCIFLTLTLCSQKSRSSHVALDKKVSTGRVRIPFVSADRCDQKAT